MNAHQLELIHRWGGRAAAVSAYLCALGLAAAGAGLVFLSLSLAVLTRAQGTAAAAMLGGAALALAGGWCLIRLLGGSLREIRRRTSTALPSAEKATPDAAAEQP